MKVLYKVDDEGFMIYGEEILINEGEKIPSDGFNYISKPTPRDEQGRQLGFYKLKWDGHNWIEGESEQERLERENKHALEALKPTEQELEDAVLEIKMLSLLLEMGVI